MKAEALKSQNAEEENTANHFLDLFSGNWE